jgi:cytochrome c553
MLKIVYTQNYKGKRRGDTDLVSRNIAHGLIDKGIAKLFNVFNTREIKKPTQDKQMKPKKEKTRGELRAERRAKKEAKAKQEYKTK